MTNGLVKKIYSKNTIEHMERKIKLLGSNTKYKTLTFLNTRLIICIILFIVLLFSSDKGYIIAPIYTIIVYVLSEYLLLDYPIKKRGKKLEKEALFFFEILTLTLESGRNLKHSLDLTCENVDSEISEEFKTMLAEVKLGKSLNEAMESLKGRIPSENINNAILNMMQSNTFGNSIIDSMYNQIDFLREKQMLDVKASIQKLPTKVSIISVIFFVPIMMLIILAPVLINYLLS